eukprot:scaffold8509_cov119-Isochrysis_galbana.AAC.3
MLLRVLALSSTPHPFRSVGPGHPVDYAQALRSTVGGTSLTRYRRGGGVRAIRERLGGSGWRSARLGGNGWRRARLGGSGWRSAAGYGWRHIPFGGCGLRKDGSRAGRTT